MEEWKIVSGYHGDYSVSSLGNISSRKMKSKIILRPGLDTGGYPHVVLCLDGTRHNHKVHRVVAKEFVPNPFGYSDVNHKNGVKTDNRAENLEWCNDSMNTAHAFAMGLAKPLKGSKNPNSKLTEKDVLEIRKDYALSPKGYTVRLSHKYKVSPNTILEIVKRTKWKHV